MRKPFYRKSHKCWYVWASGKQVRLDPDEQTAFALWNEMVAAADSDALTASLASIAEAFLRNYRKRADNHSIDPETYDRVSRVVADFCEFQPDGDAQFGRMQARKLKRHHLTAFLGDISRREWSVHQIRYAIGAVHSMFQWGVEEELLPRNPYARYPRPRANRREQLIEDAHHMTLMQSVDRGWKTQRRSAVFRQVLIALKHCGGRSGMICNVDIKDTDTESDTPAWLIHEHKTKKKTGKVQVVYLSPCLATLTRIASHGRTSGPVFRNSKQERWTPNAIRIRFRRIRERHNLPEGTVAYAYRHTYITTALVNGVGVATVAELVGHSDISMIQKHYGHLAKKSTHLSEAARKATE